MLILAADPPPVRPFWPILINAVTLRYPRSCRTVELSSVTIVMTLNGFCVTFNGGRLTAVSSWRFLTIASDTRADTADYLTFTVIPKCGYINAVIEVLIDI